MYLGRWYTNANWNNLSKIKLFDNLINATKIIITATNFCEKLFYS